MIIGNHLLMLPNINPSSLRIRLVPCNWCSVKVVDIENEVIAWEGSWHIKVIGKMSLDEFVG